MTKESDSLIWAFSIGIPALIGFHEYSTYLSSPYTTQKLSEGNEEDAATVWQLYFEATLATFIWTIAVGGVLSWGQGSIVPLAISLISAAGVAVWVYTDYARALAGEL